MKRWTWTRLKSCGNQAGSGEWSPGGESENCGLDAVGASLMGRCLTSEASGCQMLVQNRPEAGHLFGVPVFLDGASLLMGLQIYICAFSPLCLTYEVGGGMESRSVKKRELC